MLASIRHVKRYYHVDPDRIYLTGMSNGGIGAWLIGMHHAPLFAGIAPMASGLDDLLMPFLVNLKNTAIYIIHGAKDQVRPVGYSAARFRTSWPRSAPSLSTGTSARTSHGGWTLLSAGRIARMCDWLDRQRREPLRQS